MPDRVTVSVVIPTYRKRDVLEPTLRSLAEQTYPSELTEVVVVDDCSDDGTFEFLQSLSLPHRLVALRHDENRGRAAARNTAIRAATGDLIVFVDDDMRCVPELIARHVACHELHPRCAIVGSALTAPELGRSTVYDYLDRMGVHRLPPGSRIPSRYFVTNNSSVERRHLLTVGLFDETFRRYGFEDAEVAFRLEDQVGLSFRHCEGAVAYHMHRQTIDEVLGKRLETARPLVRLLAKHPERAAELSADVLLPLAPGDSLGLKLRKIAMAAATNRLFYSAIRGIARNIWLRGASDAAMVYLIACQYRKGLREVALEAAERGPTV